MRIGYHAFSSKTFYHRVLTQAISQWNSTSWDEFSRKWNKPVHNFLLRHVYASTITSYQLSRSRAMLVTFLLSAAAHELVMAVVTKKIRYALPYCPLTLIYAPTSLTTKHGRMYLFAMQLIQIPLIAVGRTSVIKRNNLLGNTCILVGIIRGVPTYYVWHTSFTEILTSSQRINYKLVYTVA
jgi:sterol O-acyltransferase